MPDSKTLLLLDVSTLELRRSGRMVSVVRADGAQLCRVRAAEGESTRATVLRCLRSALGAPLAAPTASGLLLAEVALYNPATAMISVAGATCATVYGDGTPVALPAEGITATATAAHVAVAGRLIPVAADASRSLSRELAAHRHPLFA